MEQDSDLGDKPNTWNIFSVSCPFIGILVSGFIFYFLQIGGSDSWGIGRFIGSLFVEAIFLIVGVIAGIAAIIRGEKNSTLSVWGILLNGAPVVFVIGILTMH
jgi:hypothetical protein